MFLPDVPTVPQEEMMITNKTLETPELPSTYIDISGTWYYTRIWHKEPLGEYTAVIKYEENKTLPSKLSFPMCIAFTCETIKPNGGFEGKWWGGIRQSQ